MISEKALEQEVNHLINIGPTKCTVYDSVDLQQVKLINALRDACILLLRELISTNKEIEELRIRVYNHP